MNRLLGRRRLAVQNVGHPYVRPTRESNPQLQPQVTQGQSGSPGVYDEMTQGWPAVGKHIGDLRTALAMASVRWEPVEDETIEEARFREDLEAILADSTADADNGLDGLSYIAEQWVSYWSMGVYLANINTREHPTPPRNYSILDDLRIEVYAVHPSTVLQWEQTVDLRKVLAVRQQSTSGGATIKADELIWVQRGGVVGEFAGSSILRPLVFPFERWKSIWLAAQKNAVMQSGLLLVGAPMNAPGGSEAWMRMRETLVGWGNSFAPFVMHEAGWEVGTLTPQASAGTDEIDKLDNYARETLGDQVSALIASASGHRALGDVAATDAAAKAQSDMQVFLHRWGQRYATWVARAAGYIGRLPSLAVTAADTTATPVERVNVALAAKAAQAVTWSPADETWVREQLEMPALEEPVQEVVEGELAEPAPVTAAPEAAPMDDDADTEDDAEVHLPPLAAQLEAASALNVRQGSAERGLQHQQQYALAKRIASGEPLTALEMRMLHAYFTTIGDPTQAPDYATRGPSWQDFHGRGGDPMRQWLTGELAPDVDSTPVAPPEPAPAPLPQATGAVSWSV